MVRGACYFTGQGRLPCLLLLPYSLALGISRPKCARPSRPALLPETTNDLVYDKRNCLFFSPPPHIPLQQTNQPSKCAFGVAPLPVLQTSLHSSMLDLPRRSLRLCCARCKAGDGGPPAGLSLASIASTFLVFAVAIARLAPPRGFVGRGSLAAPA